MFLLLFNGGRIMVAILARLMLTQKEGRGGRFVTTFMSVANLVGVLHLGDMEVEMPEIIHAALEYIEPERLILAPDCGMKYLLREVAFGKLCALAEGARIVRQKL